MKNLLTFIESIRKLFQQRSQTGNHFHFLGNIPHDIIMPLQEVEKLFLDLRRSDVVGIKVISLRLLLDLLSLIELLVVPSAAKLA